MDLDIGLTLAVLDEGRYRSLTERLRRAGFTADVSEQGNPTRQRWKIENDEKVTVDFLIQPSLSDDVGGKLRDIEQDFAAVIAPGLHLAFQDRTKVTLSGQTIKGERATREIWICGPGAYVVLKALAFDLRGENKDTYDLFYVVFGEMEMETWSAAVLTADRGNEKLVVHADRDSRPVVRLWGERERPHGAYLNLPLFIAQQLHRRGIASWRKQNKPLLHPTREE